MGYWSGSGPTTTPQISSTADIQTLQNQKDALMKQLQSIQETIGQIEARLRELEKQ
jgi:hypothetical protein